MNKKLGKINHPVLFDVSKAEIYLGGSTSPIDGRFAIIKAGTSEVLGVVGKKYIPVSNREVMEYFGEIATEAGIKWEFKGGHLIRGGSKSFMSLEFPDDKFELNVGDIIGVTGNLINGFDGFSSAYLDLGFSRLKCTNGMRSYTSEFKLGYRHVGEVNDKLISAFRDYFKTTLQEGKHYLNQLHKTPISKNIMLSIAEKSEWLGQKYITEVISKIPEQIKELKGKENAWVLYNAFTYVITHKMNINIENRSFLLGKLNRESLTWDK